MQALRRLTRPLASDLASTLLRGHLQDQALSSSGYHSVVAAAKYYRHDPRHPTTSPTQNSVSSLFLAHDALNTVWLLSNRRSSLALVASSILYSSDFSVHRPPPFCTASRSSFFAFKSAYHVSGSPLFSAQCYSALIAIPDRPLLAKATGFTCLLLLAVSLTATHQATPTWIGLADERLKLTSDCRLRYPWDYIRV